MHPCCQTLAQVKEEPVMVTESPSIRMLPLYEERTGHRAEHWGYKATANHQVPLHFIVTTAAPSRTAPHCANDAGNVTPCLQTSKCEACTPLARPAWEATAKGCVKSPYEPQQHRLSLCAVS